MHHQSFMMPLQRWQYYAIKWAFAALDMHLQHSQDASHASPVLNDAISALRHASPVFIEKRSFYKPFKMVHHKSALKRTSSLTIWQHIFCTIALEGSQ
eukprot:2019990-Karenia_brevis.AAC.1